MGQHPLAVISGRLGQQQVGSKRRTSRYGIELRFHQIQVRPVINVTFHRRNVRLISQAHSLRRGIRPGPVDQFDVCLLLPCGIAKIIKGGGRSPTTKHRGKHHESDNGGKSKFTVHIKNPRLRVRNVP